MSETQTMFKCSVSSSDLLPLDLLTKALPRPGQAPPTQVVHRLSSETHQAVQVLSVLSEQVQMVQSRGSRGLRLTSAPPTALSFPASQIFTSCDYFPAEFSLVATVKVQKLRQKVNLQKLSEPGGARSALSNCCCPLCCQASEYIFSVVKEESDSLLLGLRISEDRLHLLTTLPGAAAQSPISFKDVRLDNDMWHTVVLSVSGRYATLTTNCGLPLEL